MKHSAETIIHNTLSEINNSHAGEICLWSTY